MNDKMDERIQQENNNNPEESEVVVKNKENEESLSFLTDDFKCGELLLDADEDREAFKLFLRVAVEEKRQDAIDKMLYIALKNSHNAELLDNETWKEIENLSKKGKGFEYAYLLLHFKYYSKAGVEGNEIAYKYLKDYFEYCKKNGIEVSPIANLQMGICLEFGVGISADEVDTKAANEYYQKALDRGCVVAYKYIVCSSLYGSIDFPEDKTNAKSILVKGIKCFKHKFEKKEKDIKPFFEELVRCCFLFNNDKLGTNMINKGKEHAQYMIDNGIKGGYRLMGDYYLYGNEDFNLTMAKNYYEEAIKNNEGAAYGQLALIYSIEGNDEGNFTMAHKGCSENHSFSYTFLGKMYEELGKKGNERKYLLSAWDYYEKAYYRFGLSLENLGRLYLDEGILPETYNLEELERILEIGAKQLRAESIKYYLRLILRNHGLKDLEIDFKMVNELPEEYRKKYNDYLEKGAYTGDVDLINEYIKSQDSKHINETTLNNLYKKLLENQPYLNDSQIESVYKYADEKTRIKVTQKITKLPYITGNLIKIIYTYADDTSKTTTARCLLKRPFLYIDQMESLYKYADGETKLKLTHKLLKEPYLLDKDELETVYNYSDEKTRAKLFNKIIKDCNNDQIEFIYEYADEKTKAKLSKKLIMDSHIANSKKQFAEIIENFKGKLDNSFVLWLYKSSLTLFYNENKNEYIKFISTIRKGIEKTEDQNLKELWQSIQKKVDDAGWSVIETIDDKSIKKRCASYRKNRGYTNWGAIIKSLYKIVGSMDEITKEKFASIPEKIEDAIWGEAQNQFPLISDFMSAISNSKDTNLKKMFDRYYNKLIIFIDSCFSELDNESNDDNVDILDTDN